MIEFKLTKNQHFAWDYYHKPNSYRLNQELVEWLSSQNITYQCETRQEKFKDGYTYLQHYILIADPKKAMMFKLAQL